MNQLVISFGLFFLGAALGSFAAAQVWRLRAWQLKQDKAAGESVDQKEYNRLKPLTQSSVSSDRSRCLDCEYRLRWYDLLPVVSWLSLGGKCRRCKIPIGRFEILTEVLLGAAFVISFLVWPYGFSGAIDIALFVAWLAALTCMAILAAYDGKWFLLPDSANWTLAGIGLVVVSLFILRSDAPVVSQLISLGGSLFIMSGIYLILYLISKGRWIGFGDIKLGIGLGLLLHTWQMAFLALFLANLLGVFIVLPLMASKRLSRKSQIPFGPFLLVATCVTFLFGASILNWYFSFTTMLFL